MSVHQKIQSIGSSRLAGFKEHKYNCLVLLYRIYILDEGLGVAHEKKFEKIIRFV